MAELIVHTDIEIEDVNGLPDRLADIDADIAAIPPSVVAGPGAVRLWPASSTWPDDPHDGDLFPHIDTSGFYLYANGSWTLLNGSVTPEPPEPDNPATPPPSVPLSSFRQPGDTFTQALGRLTEDTVVEVSTNETFADFGMGGNVYGVYVEKLVGLIVTPDGSLLMEPGTSTHADKVNGLPSGATTQETLIRLGRGSSKVTTPYFSGALLGSEQGHIYNGLIIYYATGGIVEDAYFIGIPGSGSAPPDETFSLNVLNSTDVQVRRITIDGEGVAAAGLGFNNGARPVVEDSTFMNMGFGAGVTQYQTDSPTYRRCEFRDVYNYGINCEKVPGVITVEDCIFSGCPSADMCVDTNGSSAIVNISDPIWDGMENGSKFRVKRHAKYAYPPVDNPPENGQRIEDIHLFMDGVEVTSTLLQIVT